MAINLNVLSQWTAVTLAHGEDYRKSVRASCADIFSDDEFVLVPAVQK